MIRDPHGLVIGKFYPPHRGHHDLVRTAGAGCDRVTVVVMASLAETISLADRVAWLRAEHASDAVDVVGIRCDAPLDVTDDSVWAAQVASMRAAVRLATDEPVTSVWSAEDYGAELAARLGARHRRVTRSHDGLSGSRVRANLPACWVELAGATRAGLCTRVVLVGAESTGTTTIARALAEHYRTRGAVWSRTACVEEYGREFTEVLWARQVAQARSGGLPEPALDDVVWAPSHFDEVATEQTRREEAAAAAGSPLLICDTDAFATSIWERRYLGQVRPVQAWALPPQRPCHDLYLVTDHEGVPWSDDGLREGDLMVRAAMTGWFVDALTAADESWVLLTGPLAQRLELARRTIDQVLAHRFTFGQPLSGPGFGVG